MFKVILTNVVISKGYDNAPALKFSQGAESEVVRFRVGDKRYDRNAPNNARWINISVKAFGSLCDRIRKMKLKEGSVINIFGKYDEENWSDDKTGVEKSLPIIIADDVEYASLGGGSKKDNNGQSEQNAGGYPEQPTYPNTGMGFAAPAASPAGYPNQMGGTPMPPQAPNTASGNMATPANPQMAQGNQGMGTQPNFTGFEPFGGGSYFDKN